MGTSRSVVSWRTQRLHDTGREKWADSFPPVIDRMDAISREGAYQSDSGSCGPQHPLSARDRKNKRWEKLAVCACTSIFDFAWAGGFEANVRRQGYIIAFPTSSRNYSWCRGSRRAIIGEFARTANLTKGEHGPNNRQTKKQILLHTVQIISPVSARRKLAISQNLKSSEAAVSSKSKALTLPLPDWALSEGERLVS